MTDARYPERWLTDKRVVRLTDSAHRLFVVAMAWSAGNRTDGELSREDLYLMPGADPHRADELVAAELWRPTASGWQIVDYDLTQSTREQLQAAERARSHNRLRQQRHRARKSSSAPPNMSSAEAVGSDNERDVTRDMTRENTGQARTGKARTGSKGQEIELESSELETAQPENRHPGRPHDRLSAAARQKMESGYDD